MEPSGNPTVYTIGHSNRELVDFMAMLESFSIECLVDIRRFPGSRKFPQFSEESLEAALADRGIAYRHAEALGGRRKVQEASRNHRWRNDSFRGYADYMETDEFEEAATALEALARGTPTAYMCSEAVWWRCHRSMVSDYLKAGGWTVLHIMDAGKANEHPYTSPARVVGDAVVYFDSPDATGAAR